MSLKPKHQRALMVAAGLASLAIGGGLAVHALSANMLYFTTPSSLMTEKYGATSPNDKVKLGGMVVAGTYLAEIAPSRRPINFFDVTDGQGAVRVRFQGVLPDLFREGQSVVAVGTYDPTTKIFTADRVLARHDETYMPKEVADALRKSGKWDPRFGKAPDLKGRNTIIDRPDG